MTLKAYLVLMSIATLVAVGCFMMVAGLVDPFTTNSLGLLMFYASLFITVMGAASILGFIFRFVIFRRRLAMSAVTTSFRQAFLTAFVTVAVFWMFSQQLFSWLNLLAIIIGFSALEFFLLSLTHDQNKET